MKLLYGLFPARHLNSFNRTRRSRRPILSEFLDGRIVATVKQRIADKHYLLNPFFQQCPHSIGLVLICDTDIKRRLATQSYRQLPVVDKGRQFALQMGDDLLPVSMPAVKLYEVVSIAQRVRGLLIDPAYRTEVDHCPSIDNPFTHNSQGRQSLKPRKF